MRYSILTEVNRSIILYYENVYNRYINTSTIDSFLNNISITYDIISQIGDGGIGRILGPNAQKVYVPNLLSDVEYRFLLCKDKKIQWFFVYYIDKEDIIVVDAIKPQNATVSLDESFNPKYLPEIQAILDLEQRMDNL